MKCWTNRDRRGVATNWCRSQMAEMKPEIAESAGCLQLCAGQKSGCEASAHAMRDMFAEEETGAVLLIDASNTFNALNRDVSFIIFSIFAHQCRHI